MLCRSEAQPVRAVRSAVLCGAWVGAAAGPLKLCIQGGVRTMSEYAKTPAEAGVLLGGSDRRRSGDLSIFSPAGECISADEWDRLHAESQRLDAMADAVEKAGVTLRCQRPVHMIGTNTATGEQAHSGSALMADRRDALLGAVKLIVAARELPGRCRQRGPHLPRPAFTEHGGHRQRGEKAAGDYGRGGGKRRC